MSSCGASLFGNVGQYIKVNSGDFIAVQGSDIRERLITSDLRMPYKQIMKSRIILKPGQINYLLNHLGLGDNATFLAVRATYNPKSVIADDNYINWSYYDDMSRINHFAQMMVLTGNSTNRIPQLYLTNPNTKYSVSIDVMVAVIDDQYSIFTDTFNQIGTTFTGLEYTDIKTWVLGDSIVIYDKATPKRPLIYINLVNINSIEINDKILTIDDESYGQVILVFIDHYNASQAHSLLNYVLRNPSVDIDTILPSYDNVDPVIYFNSTAGVGGDYILPNDGVIIGGTAFAPYNTTYGNLLSIPPVYYQTSISLSVFGSASIIDRSLLKTLLIDHVVDNRDGIIELLPTELIIGGTSGEVSSISSTGTYSLTFGLKDIADNNLSKVVVNLNITT